MSAGQWEYKVVFVDSWRRTSVEGTEAGPQENERTSAFARRFLNGMGVEGWELTGIQHTQPGQAYYIFKRPLADGATPDMSVVKSEPRQQPAPEQTPPGGSEVVSL
jgi:hypothetical protein